MPRHSLALFTLLLATWTALSVSSAMAQDETATRSAAARALFEEGLREADAERWQPAAEHFRRALALRSSAVIRLNLAIALGHAGQVVEAAELLRHVLRDAEAPEEARATAGATLAVVERRIAWIRLEVRGEREGAEVRIDDRRVSPELADAPIPTDPGRHVVSLHTAGHAPARHTVALRDGGSQDVVLVVPEGETAAATALPPASGVDLSLRSESPAVATMSERSDGPDPVVVGVATAGGVVLVAGIVTVVLVLALPSEASAIPGNVGVIEVGR